MTVRPPLTDPLKKDRRKHDTKTIFFKVLKFFHKKEKSKREFNISKKKKKKDTSRFANQGDCTPRSLTHGRQRVPVAQEGRKEGRRKGILPQ